MYRPSESKTEQQNNQSQSNRTFKNKSGVNKRNGSEKNTSGQSDNSASKSSCILKQHSNTIQKEKLTKSNPETTAMDRDKFYHWSTTREIMEIIRRRNKSPVTRRRVELRNASSNPGTLRRRYDRTHNRQSSHLPNQTNATEKK